MTLEGRIEELVERSPTMTFSELLNRLGDEARGDRTIIGSRIDTAEPTPDPNAIMWIGTSVAFNEAFVSLLHAGRIHPTLTSPLVYAYDGEMLDLPGGIGTSPRKGGFKEPTWVPVVLNPGPASVEAR